MIGAIFTRRVRGVRVINLWGGAVLLVLVVGLYLVKTFAGGERADIARTESSIVDERHRIRLLQAEVSYLEQPERISRLSEQYLGLQPTSGKRETAPGELGRLASAGGTSK